MCRVGCRFVCTRLSHNLQEVVFASFPAPSLPDQLMVCEECKKKFAESFLWGNFGLLVCDTCR